MKQLLVVKPNTISPKDKEKLTKEGFILIEHESPADIKIITQLSGVSGEDVFASAIDGCNYSSGSQLVFAQSLLKKIKKP